MSFCFIFLTVFIISIFVFLLLTYNFSKNNIRINYPILYINLDRSSDRKNYMENEFKKNNIKNYTRISGVDGKKITNMKEGIVDGIKYNNKYTRGSKYELACTLSHLKAIKYAYDNNINEVLILEDDASFELMKYWHDSLGNIVKKEAPKDWEILQLYSTKNCFNKIEKKFVRRTNDDCFSTVVYLINKKGMKKVLDFCYDNNRFELGKIINNKIFPLKIVADFFIYKIPQNVYVYKFPLIIPNNDELDSIIHPQHTKFHLQNRNYYKSLYNI